MRREGAQGHHRSLPVAGETRWVGEVAARPWRPLMKFSNETRTRFVQASGEFIRR
jgi:hypothetical protein